MSVLVRIGINALALLAAARLVGGVEVQGFEAALVAALVLGLINVTLRPILVVLTIPINVVTLGLFTFVINALMLLLVSRVVAGFEIAGFWPALLAALLLSIVSSLLSSMTGARSRRRR
ncbi:MAG: phage holin family protein [Bacillota bacterium]|nr:phage holin family protein [Bacillota bacterium]